VAATTAFIISLSNLIPDSPDFIVADSIERLTFDDYEK
jgi:hypothetical protein